MTLIYKAAFALILALAAPRAWAQSSFPATVNVIGARYSGLKRTNQEWLEGYIGLKYPVRLASDDAALIANKLLVTGVFTSVKTSLENAPTGVSDERVLHVEVEEKWTLIPVIRGAFGGGTPLRVFGVYDIHTFGSHVILGGEARKYGDADPGFVLYARLPRHEGGRHFVGGEVWRDLRLRSVFDDDGKEIGRLATNAQLSRVRVLTSVSPENSLGQVRRDPWKVGIDVSVVRESPSSFTHSAEYEGSGNVPATLRPRDDIAAHAALMPNIHYDDLDTDNLHLDGLKLDLRIGPVVGSATSHSRMITEFFAYEQWSAASLNLGVHGYVYTSSLDTLYSRQFLGGLDSVRGLPDGFLQGTRAAYLNTELRYTALRLKYLWVQSVLFQDTGAAGDSWEATRANARATAGGGLRFAVPQIYRLVIRLDYAWAVDGSGTHGLAAGFNHFFDPYRPL